MANEVPSLDDRVMPAHKLELTPEEAEFAATQGREADDPVPDPSSLSDETLEEEAAPPPQPADAGPSVKWPANDKDAPDYRHLSTSQILVDSTFRLTPDDIELVLSANRFDPHGKFKGDDATQNEVIAIAMRGLMLGQGRNEIENARSVEVIDARPDHSQFRCVVGFYIRTQDPGTRTLTLYSGSTVPNPMLMKAYFDKVAAHAHEPFEKCNMLPTGCYVCRVDHHKDIEPALRMAEPDDLKSDATCTVQRTFNDLTYGLDDLWDIAHPYDNVHCAYATFYNGNWRASFSSEGCITVRGRRTPTDQWAKFEAVLNKIGMQRRCDLVLLTGRDLAVASKLRGTNQADNAAVVQRELVCLRAGSTGEEVRRLRSKLGLPDGTYFGATVKKHLADKQSAMSAGKEIDGIYSPALDAQWGWGVLTAVA